MLKLRETRNFLNGNMIVPKCCRKLCAKIGMAAVSKNLKAALTTIADVLTIYFTDKRLYRGSYVQNEI